MKNLTWAIVFSASFASAAFAQAEAETTITCADFRAMDASGRAEAVEAVQMAAAEGGMESDGMASDETDGMAPDQMSGDGMASDEMASDGMASDEMASGEMMGSDQMSSGDAMMAEDTVAAVLEVCNRDLNVLLADALKEATGH